MWALLAVIPFLPPFLGCPENPWTHCIESSSPVTAVTIVTWAMAPARAPYSLPVTRFARLAVTMLGRGSPSTFPHTLSALRR